MRRRIAGLLLSLGLFVSLQPTTANAFMDCYPAKVYRKADGSVNACWIDSERSCMYCQVTYEKI